MATFLTVTVMILAQQLVATSSSGLIFFLIDLQQALESSKIIKMKRRNVYVAVTLCSNHLGEQLYRERRCQLYLELYC